MSGDSLTLLGAVLGACIALLSGFRVVVWLVRP